MVGIQDVFLTRPSFQPFKPGLETALPRLTEEGRQFVTAMADSAAAGGVCRIAPVGSLPCNPEGMADGLHRSDAELGELRAAAAAGSVFKDHRLVDHGGVIRRHELTDPGWELIARSCHRSTSPYWQAG
ncbi:hypothetical protein ACICHK_01115 [Streptomyces sp. AHU1]|uniref:hypothetical protein n=1 Tax=Streptomyces sp. AHU1 TaxID=3377215 RepID=UPI0038779610